MSIFSTIKYPISLPPTPDELRALPTNVYIAWVISAFGEGYTYYEPEFLALAFDAAYRAAPDDPEVEAALSTAVKKLNDHIFNIDE